MANNTLVLDRYWSLEGSGNFEKNWQLIETSGTLVDASGRRWSRHSTNTRKARIRDLLRSGSLAGVFSFGRQQLVWIPVDEIERDGPEIARNYDRKDRYGRNFRATVWNAENSGGQIEHLVLFVEDD